MKYYHDYEKKNKIHSYSGILKIINHNISYVILNDDWANDLSEYSYTDRRSTFGHKTPNANEVGIGAQTPNSERSDYNNESPINCLHLSNAESKVCENTYLNKDKKTIIVILNSTYVNRCFHNNLVIIELLANDLPPSKQKFFKNLNLKFNILGSGKIINQLSLNNNLYISGILCVNEKINYGKTKKNVPIYLFKPCDSKYPYFLVPSNFKNVDKVNVYAFVKFKEWKINQKYPIGMCEKIIGNIGISTNEYQHLLYKYQLVQKDYKNKTIQNLLDKLPSPSNINRKEYFNHNIFSVDPIGCLDKDDAIHIEHHNKIYKVVIHISDVSSYITENSELDLEAKKRLTTIYLPNKNIHMLPTQLSENILSLLQGKKRYCISTEIYIDENKNIIKYDIHRSIIINNYSLNYDECEDIIHHNKNHKIQDDIKKIYEITKHLYNKNYESHNINFDSHKMIEILMVLTNKIIGEKLYKFNRNNLILRTHNKIGENKSIHPIISKCNHLNDFLNHINSQSANYKSSHLLIYDEISHYGLNCKFYTHFTSPIRRYVDIIVHRILTHILLNNASPNTLTNYNILCDNLNNINKRIKKLSRDTNKIKLIEENLQNKLTSAYIYKINSITNKIYLFLDEYHLSFDIYILNFKLNKIIEIISDSNEIIIKRISDSQTLIKYKLYQKLNILISSRLGADHFKNKIIISLLNKDNEKIIDLIDNDNSNLLEIQKN